jgi:CheY-like chemotaxis protein
MPEMDGYEVVAEARKISPSLHVVFMSAFAPDLARQPGGDSFLAKPFTSESLTNAIDKALAG